MILLTGTSHLLRVVTATAANLQSHVTWVDSIGVTITPGRTNTVSITTATTTTICGSPAASTYRSVQTVAISNTHATAASMVKIIHSDGTNTPVVYTCTLFPGWSLQYCDHSGWRVTSKDGLLLSAGLTVPADNTINTTVLTSTHRSTANTYADVTALSFAVVSGSRYWFRFMLAFSGLDGTGNGIGYSINGPSSPTELRYHSWQSLSTIQATQVTGITAYDTPAAPPGSVVSTTANVAVLEGTIMPSADGNVIARIISEFSGYRCDNIKGSLVHFQRIS